MRKEINQSSAEWLFDFPVHVHYASMQICLNGP